MEQNIKPDEIVLDVPVSPAAAQSLEAPKMKILLKDGWQFTKLRMDLLKWYVFSLAATAFFGSGYMMEGEGILTFVATIAVFISTIFLAMNSWAIIYVTMQPDDSLIGYKQAFKWSSNNFFPLLWTTILSGLAVIGGMIVLVIPGIALSIYLYFSVYAVASGTKYGPSALKQSYNDIKGRWWEVVFKLLTLSAWLLLLLLIPIVIYAVTFSYIDENSFGFMVIDTFLQGSFGGVVGMMAIYALAQYYKYLQANPA